MVAKNYELRNLRWMSFYVDRAVNLGGGGGFDCTVNVSSAIKGIEPFTGISISTLPSSLADELDSLKNPCTGWFCW